MLAGVPFHITHRGNLKRTVFRDATDRAAYLSLFRRYAETFETSVWAYCLMGNHIHLLLIGARRESISKTMGNAHRHYARRLHEAANVTGHLWANRFFSAPLDDLYLWAVVRYIELNPVRGGLVKRATDWPWSSARTHAGLATDPLLDPARPFPGPIEDWEAWLELGLEDELADKIRGQTLLGRPIGDADFEKKIEKLQAERVKVSPKPRFGKRPHPEGSGCLKKKAVGTSST